MLNALYKNWSSFVWSWAFMIWFVVGGLTASAHGYVEAFFWLSVPLLFYSQYRATRPWFRGTASYLHTVFWAMFFPFLIACALTFLGY